MAWAQALQRHYGPAALALSRQALPALVTGAQVDGVARGGYVWADAPEGRSAQVVLIGTGSELQLAVQAREQLAAAGIAARVVSMPCTNVFDRQVQAYQDAVLPPHLPAVAVEAAQPDFWRKYVGRSGAVVGIASFGESAPAADLYRHFGLTVERVVQAAQDLLTRATASR